MIARCSADTLYRRFFTPIPQPAEGETMLERLPRAGPGDAVSVVELDGLIVGLGSFHRTGNPDEAEIALLVEDGYQGQGLGTALVADLVVRARAAGVKRLIADTLVGNRGPLRAMERAGYQPQREASASGVARAVISLDSAPETSTVSVPGERRPEGGTT